MSLTLSIIVFAVGAVLSLLSFFKDYKKKKKLSFYNALYILIFFAFLVFGTWYTVDQSRDNAQSKNEIVGTVKASAISVNSKIDTVGKEITNKLEHTSNIFKSRSSTHRNSTPPVSYHIEQKGNDNVGVNNGIIIKGSVYLTTDRFLTGDKLNDLYKEVESIRESKGVGKGVLVMKGYSCNAPKVVNQIIEFFTQKGYEVGSGGNFSEDNAINIQVLPFKDLSKTMITIGYFDN